MFSSYKFIIGGSIILFISLGVFAGYKYVTNMQQQLKFQTAELTKIKISNKSLMANRTQLEQNIRDNKKNQTRLNVQLRNARTSKDKLIKLFSDHNFARLVNKKPGLMQIKINKGTDRVFKELEVISNE